jgi:very-short-patch-repair endonuclease
MSYKQKLHPQVSNAEIEIFKELSKRGLTEGMVTQKPIVLKVTIPDFTWQNKRKALFLDGDVVHYKDKAAERDVENTALLEARGYNVLRVRYTPPLTEKEKKRILGEITDWL